MSVGVRDRWLRRLMEEEKVIKVVVVGVKSDQSHRWRRERDRWHSSSVEQIGEENDVGVGVVNKEGVGVGVANEDDRLGFFGFCVLFPMPPI